MRWMRKRLRKIALHNEALADRNWELKEAEERARSLFESQGDLIVLRDADGRITFVNDAYCELAQQPRGALIGSRFSASRFSSRATRLETERHAIHDQKIATPLGPRWIAWREGLVRTDAGQPAEMQCVGRDVTDRTETERAPRRGPRPGRRRQPRQVAFPRDGIARNSHAAERHHRHERTAARHRR